MRRLMAFIIALILICSQGVVFSEELQPEIKAYRFDLKMSLDANAFPEKDRDSAKGYADLFNCLRFRGELYLTNTMEFDLRLTIIPNENEEAALRFRIYGAEIVSYISSPLFGNAEMEFLNTALSEFVLKIYNHMGIPLHWLSFLFPFVRNEALTPFINSWEEIIAPAAKSGMIPAEEWKKLAESWRPIVNGGWYFGLFVTSLGIASGKDDLLRQIFTSIPDTLVRCFGKGVDVQKDKGKETWKYGDKTFFEKTVTPASESWRLSPPLLLDDQVSVAVSADHRKAEKGMDHHILFNIKDKKNGALIDFDLKAEAVPDKLPADADFLVKLDLTGLLFPQISGKINCHFTQGGDVRLSLDLKPEGLEEKKGLFTVQGVFSSFDPDKDHSFSSDKKEMRVFEVFFVNDNRLVELIDAIMEPAIKCMIPFIAELPVSACQTVLDTLIKTGIFDAMFSK